MYTTDVIKRFLKKKIMTKNQKDLYVLYNNKKE